MTAPDARAADPRVPAVDVCLLLATGALLLSVFTGSHGAGRLPLVLLFITVVPGWAVIGWAASLDMLSRVALAVALSLAVCAGGAMLMIELHRWSPAVMLTVLGAGSGLALTLRIAARRRGLGRVVASALHTIRRGRLVPADALVPVSLGLVWSALTRTHPSAMTDYGLLPALPPGFFLGIAVLVVSFAIVLARDPLSRVRLGIHVVALVLVLYGTVPSIFPDPQYSWVYKHFGVVAYIDAHHAVDSTIDVYQNWPGFFVLAAWVKAVSGGVDPVRYAAWAPVYFELLTVVELGYAIRALGGSARVRWLAVFLFVAANWVGQDYYSPQAFAYVLCLAVLGAVLHHCSRRGAGGRSRGVAVAAIYGVFAVIVVSHQLTPYMIIFAVLALTVCRAVRPRWLVVGMIVMAVAYLVPHVGIVSSQYALFTSPLHPWGNLVNQDVGYNEGLPGRLLSANSARMLGVVMWSLGALGCLHRAKKHEPVLLPLALMVAPVVTLIEGYEGEAVYRMFLFSLPWASLLAASAIPLRLRSWSVGSSVRSAAVVAAVVALFLPAYLGNAELYEMRPGEVQASAFLDAHAPKGSVILVVEPNFPGAIGARYDEIRVVELSPDLLDGPDFRGRTVGPTGVEAINEVARIQDLRVTGPAYLAVTRGMRVYAHIFDLVPDRRMASLDGALDRSSDWRLAYRNADAAIYRYAGPPAPRPMTARSASGHEEVHRASRP